MRCFPVPFIVVRKKAYSAVCVPGLGHVSTPLKQVACATPDRKDQEWGQMTSQRKISVASRRKGMSAASCNHRTHPPMAKRPQWEGHCGQKQSQALKARKVSI